MNPSREKIKLSYWEESLGRKILFSLMLMSIIPSLVVSGIIFSTSCHAEEYLKFYEVNKQFFSQPKTYSIEQVFISIGSSGIGESYKDGESTFTVNNNGYTYKLKDGSTGSNTLTSQLKNLAVLSSNDNVSIPMYMIEDGEAVRVIQNSNGSYTVYEYAKNYDSGKYVPIRFFILRK